MKGQIWITVQSKRALISYIHVHSNGLKNRKKKLKTKYKNERIE